MPVIAETASAAYLARVSIRQLFATVIAFAVLFAPLAMQSGAAMAMAPAKHHAEMTKAGHCGEQPSKHNDATPMDASFCVAMCAAVAIPPVSIPEPACLAHSAEHPAVDLVRHNFLAELPTPPPRLA